MDPRLQLIEIADARQESLHKLNHRKAACPQPADNIDCTEFVEIHQG
jgi:hypothetical protein